MRNRVSQDTQELNFIQKGMSFGLSLLTMSGWAFSAASNLATHIKTFPTKEMVAMGVAPIGKMAESMSHAGIEDLGDYVSFSTTHFTGKNGVKFVAGIVTALLAGLGAGYLVDHFDAEMLASDSELVKEIEALIKTGATSSIIASMLGYVAATFTGGLLQKFWIKQDAEQIEKTPQASAPSRVMNTLVINKLLRESIIQANQVEFLRTPFAGLLVPAVEQLTNIWYAASNTPKPIDTLLGRESETLPLGPINDGGAQPVATNGQAFKNSAWYTLRLLTVLGIGWGMNEAVEKTFGSKEDMTETKRFLADIFVVVSTVLAEKAMDNHKLLYAGAKAVGTGLVNTAGRAGSGMMVIAQSGGTGLLGIFGTRSQSLLDSAPRAQYGAVSSQVTSVEDISDSPETTPTASPTLGIRSMFGTPPNTTETPANIPTSTSPSNSR